jgi:hypothetical protein
MLVWGNELNQRVQKRLLTKPWKKRVSSAERRNGNVAAVESTGGSSSVRQWLIIPTRKTHCPSCSEKESAPQT